MVGFPASDASSGPGPRSHEVSGTGHGGHASRGVRRALVALLAVPLLLGGCGSRLPAQPRVGRRRARRTHAVARPRRLRRRSSTTRGCRCRPGAPGPTTSSDVDGRHQLTVTVADGPEIAGVADHRPGEHRGGRAHDRLLRAGRRRQRLVVRPRGGVARRSRRCRGRAGDAGQPARRRRLPYGVPARRRRGRRHGGGARRHGDRPRRVVRRPPCHPRDHGPPAGSEPGAAGGRRASGPSRRTWPGGSCGCER